MDAPLDASILVVIVNYRTADLTIDCLNSLRPVHQQLPNLRVVVADNASSDGSVNQIEQHVRDHDAVAWVDVMPLPQNGGFAYANNQAIRPALSQPSPPDFVLLLNPDTRVLPGAITEFVQFMLAHPGVGIAGSRLESEDGTTQRSAFRFPSALGELESTVRFGPLTHLLSHYCPAPPISDTCMPTEWVAGASMLIRRPVLEDIGLLDEQYFLYFEEVDFCFRARQAGWECWYVPKSRVVHLVGQASGVTHLDRRPKRRPSYWFDSRRRYLVKNLGRFQSVVCDAAYLLGLTIWQIRCVFERKPNHDPPHLWSDSIRQSVLVKGFTISDDAAPVGLWQQWKSDYVAHRRDWTLPGFRSVAACRFGQWRMGIRWKWLRAPWSAAYRFVFRYCRNVYGIELPYTVRLGQRVVIEHQGAVVIHGNAQIGDDTVIRQGVTIGNRYLDRPFEAPVIGNRVNIGAGAQILGNIHVGDDAVIGANAVVLHDVAPGTTVVGIPARPISLAGQTADSRTLPGEETSHSEG